MNVGKMRRHLQRQRLSWARESAGLPTARPPVALERVLAGLRNAGWLALPSEDR